MATGPPPPAPSVDAAARALQTFLEAVGAPVASDPELRETAQRAARAFHDELLDGYRASPEEALAEALPTTEGALVVVTDIAYASVCPHHLLPASGRAHVGYIPGGRIVGLGALSRLVEVLAHRLVLQEVLGEGIAGALATHLGARAAGVVLDATHTCLSLRGARQAEARVVTHAFAGAWANDVVARSEFLQAVALGARSR